MRAPICLRKIIWAWENITNKDTEEQMTMQGRLGSESRGQTFKTMHKATGTNGRFWRGDRKEVPEIFGVCPES